MDGPYLRFISITPADAGRYYCHASNRYGNSTEVAEVTVNHQNVYQPQPYQPSRTQEIPERGTAILKCVVPSNVAGNIYVSNLDLILILLHFIFDVSDINDVWFLRS